MSVEATRRVWQYSKSKGSERLVMLCIADHINNDGIAWPSIETIAKETCVSERQVSRAIASLIKENELEIIKKGNGRGMATVYRITIKDDIYDIKGDMVSSFSNNGHGEKGDISSIKDDISSIKGDMVSPQPLYNHNESPYIYVHPDSDEIASIKTALSQASKTPLWAKTENEYDEAAHLIQGMGCTAVDIKAFTGWWDTNGWHKGKPVLKVLLQELHTYLDSKEAKANGHAKPEDLSWLENIPTFTDEEIALWQSSG